MTTQAPGASPFYRGSSKHKNRPANEQKGTLCPEWTHATPRSGFATDVHAHDWEQTPAARLFAQAAVDAAGRRRFATAQGIAFEAKATADGSWHGFPVPWESIPAAIKNGWLATGAVSRRDVRRFLRFDKDEIHWAMQTDAG